MRYAAYLIYIAVLTRAVGWHLESGRIPDLVWILLVLFGLILFSERTITGKIAWYPRPYTLVQSALVITMMYCAPSVDFFTMLFLPLSFQVVQFFGKRLGFLNIAGYSVAMAGLLLLGLEREAGLTMILANTGANFMMGKFADLIAGTELNRKENHRLFLELKESYRQLSFSAAQAERLAAAEERHRLVRDLHDSLTQTLFSMNLATQAAQLGITEIPREVDEHLDRLQKLADCAANDVQELTDQNHIQKPVEDNLASALKKLAEQRFRHDGLTVALQVEGQRALPAVTEAALLRIAQEALNNIVHHAGVQTALIRLCLEYPVASLQIEDAGQGFLPDRAGQSPGLGLRGMRERAEEIGWKMQLISQPGQGTQVRVVEQPE